MNIQGVPCGIVDFAEYVPSIVDVIDLDAKNTDGGGGRDLDGAATINQVA